MTYLHKVDDTNTMKTLIYKVTDASFYFDAGELTSGGANRLQYYHGHAGQNAPWNTGLCVSGEIQYCGNKIRGSVVWNPHGNGWDGDLGHCNGRISRDRRGAFLQELFGFKYLNSSYMLLGYEFNDLPLKYEEVDCYHSNLAHLAWVFRRKNTQFSFDGIKFDEKCTHGLLKIHTELAEVRR